MEGTEEEREWGHGRMIVGRKCRRWWRWVVVGGSGGWGREEKGMGEGWNASSREEEGGRRTCRGGGTLGVRAERGGGISDD